jgi:hypothetical protein
MTAVPEPNEQVQEADGTPVFLGVDQVLRLIGTLYQRPRFGDRPRDLNENTVQWGELVDRKERPGRKGLPMVCLVRPDGQHRGLLRAIDGLLDHAKPRGVRHAYIGDLDEDAPADTARAESDPLTDKDVNTIREILRESRNKLINSRRARGSRLRFPLFSLVIWLMKQRLDPDDPNAERTLLDEIQSLGINQRFRKVVETIDDKLPDDKFWWKVPLWLLRVLTVVVFRVAVTGRVPVLSGGYRWFMIQPHLAPEMSGNFVRFAERLTEGEWQQEAPEFVARLLVNAFLEDLRRAYRPQPWRLWQQRRMTYPVLLLDHITMANGGYILLRLINDVRNQVGQFDPLLVISASLQVPPDGGRDPSRPKTDAVDTAAGYRAWQNSLLADRRARRDTAWYLPVRIPGKPSEKERNTSKQRLDAFHGFTVGPKESRPPWWSSRLARLGVIVALLVGSTVGYGAWSHAHCGGWNRWPGVSPSLTWTGTECIGVTDGSYDLFQPSDASTQQVEHTILMQNQHAAALSRQFPSRPYITLVDLEALTSATGTADGLTAERESLEGFAVAQLRQLNKAGGSDPIVRILIANAGLDMGNGARVGKQLGAMAARDPSLVGVIGIDISNQATTDTITALANAGIPVVSATLSADKLADTNPMYFQIAPQNRREAAVAAAFAAQLPTTGQLVARSMRVYYSDDTNDIYSSNLRDDVLAAFRARGFHAEARAFTPNKSEGQSAYQPLGDQLVGNAVAAGRDICSYNGVVYFAGRGVLDFADFANGAAQCGSTAVVIGDDDMTSYVADSTARQQNQALPYYYVSFAPTPTASLRGPERDFYTDLDTLFAFEQTTTGRSLDDDAALTYDAALVMITATEYLREDSDTIPITPGTLWREITDIHTSQIGQPQVNKSIEGVSGMIDYGGDITRHVPLDKPVAILRVDNGQVDQELAGFCGTASYAPPSPWCPPGH